MATNQGLAAGAWSHAWAFTGSAQANPMGVDVDVRLPIRLIFTTFGVMLAVLGAVSSPRIDIDVTWAWC